MKTLTILQARMGSTRLPGKVLLPLGGLPLLLRMVERLRASKLCGDVVVATTWEPADDVISDVCRAHGVQVFRGHPTDCLDRHYQAALLHRADVVAKIPSDCPLIDPQAVDRVFQHFFDANGALDFVSNLHPQSWPDGNDVEVMSFATLEKTWKEANKDFEREHTTSYIWNHPELFRLGNVAWETGRDLSLSHRMVLDYREDYEVLQRIFDALHAPDSNEVFDVNAIVAFLDANPDVAKLNEKHRGYIWYQKHVDELHALDDATTRRLRPATTPLNLEENR